MESVRWRVLERSHLAHPKGAFKSVRMSSNNRSYSGKGLPPSGKGSVGLKRGASQFVLCHWRRDAERRRWRQRRRMARRVSVAPRGKELFYSLSACIVSLAPLSLLAPPVSEIRLESEFTSSDAIVASNRSLRT
ncbi:hypothetical protein MRX96_016561 [Rhipicephalus microplus]